MKLRLPKSRWFRAPIYVISALLVLLALDMLWVRVDRHIIVSPETTYITAPLKADGMPDYITYIDEKCKQGVTPENNAAIPFLQTVTPMLQNPVTNQDEIATGFYERLGLVPPTKPQRLAYLSTYEARHPGGPTTMPDGEVVETYIRTHPWSRADFPAAGEWMDAMDGPLNALPAITSRSRWYLAIQRPSSDMLNSVRVPYVVDLRMLTRAAMARAMLRIQEKRYGEAEADILACHRLARLVAQGWTLIEYLVGLVIDNDALAADFTLARSDISADELRKYQQQLEALPAWPERLNEALNMQRLGTLDTLIWVAQQPGEARAFLQSTRPTAGSLNVLSVALRPSNFDAALRLTNQHFDQLIAAAQVETPARRIERTTKAETQFREAIAGARGPFADTARRVLAIIAPHTASATSGDEAHRATMLLTKVGIGVQLYRLENGRLPTTLGDLAPKYLASVPVDPFSGVEFHYRKTDQGYVLYSIGPDLKDDGGKVRGEGESSYDLVLPFP